MLIVIYDKMCLKQTPIALTDPLNRGSDGRGAVFTKAVLEMP